MEPTDLEVFSDGAFAASYFIPMFGQVFICFDKDFQLIDATMTQG